jgi:hypothetical protein
MKKLLKKIRLTIIVIFLVGVSYPHVNAQPDMGEPPEEIPLDGGLLWLLLAGAGYGVKKIIDHRKKQQVL